MHTNYLFLWPFLSLPRTSLPISHPSTWEEVEKDERKTLPNAGGDMASTRDRESIRPFIMSYLHTHLVPEQAKQLKNLTKVYSLKNNFLTSSSFFHELG